MVATYWERLKPEMDAEGITAASLAKRLGISYQAVAKVRDGGAFGTENHLKVAALFHLNPEWLMSGKGQKHTQDRSPHRVGEVPALYVVPPSPPGPDHEQDLEIVEYDTGGKMGAAGLVLKDQPGMIRSWKVSPDWVHKNIHNVTSPRNLAIVTGFGDSMRPLYNPGDPLLIDTGVVTVDFDGVYFFRIGGEGYVKRLQRIPTVDGTVLRAKSDNKDYDPFDIVQAMDFEVFGRVVKVWCGTDF